MLTPCYHALSQTAIAAHLRAGGFKAQNVLDFPFWSRMMHMDSTHPTRSELMLRAFRARTAAPGFDIPRLSMWHRSLLCG